MTNETIFFNCPYCDAELKCPPDMTVSEEIIECPICAKPLKIPRSKPSPKKIVIRKRGSYTSSSIETKNDKVDTESFRNKSKRISSLRYIIYIFASSVLVLLLSGIIYLRVFRGNLHGDLSQILRQKRDITIDGSVFIVTENGLNIKLSLVPIKVCENKYLYWLLTLGAHSAIDQNFVFNESSETKTLETTEKLYERITYDYKSCLLKLPDLDRHAENKAWNRYVWGIKSGWPIMRTGMIINPPQGIKSALTDADGKFKIHIVTCENCVLVATGERIVFDQREEYLWILPMTANSQQTVMLSNHNMITNFDDLLELIHREADLLH